MVVKKLNYYLVIILSQGIILPAASCYLSAQELPSVNLKEVEITGNHISPFSVGARSELIDSTILKLSALPTLSKLLINNASLSIKSYGSGMLSTIAFRGTGASHTAILWNDINISYPMLGQSDLSLLSLVLTDKIVVQHGTGSSLYGSGALGGTISLSSKIPEPGLSLLVSQWFGSFGTIKNNIKASYAADKYFIAISTLWDKSENNFKFTNTTKIGNPVEAQQGASFQILGSSIESGVVIGKNSEILISGQYFIADRNLQASMNAGNREDIQTDENIRFKIKYKSKLLKIPWNLSYGYLHDEVGYNAQITIADHHNGRIGITKTMFHWMKLNLAADYNFIRINSPFYANTNTSEQRSNVWASFLINSGNKFVVSLNLRQSFNPDYYIPFTPSLGSEFYLIKRPQQKISLKALVAKGFRVPTMNERFWQPGGNPNLVSEESYSAEFGLIGTVTKGIILNYEITAYRMWVDNWILWTPQGNIWTPDNIKYVDVYGAELSSSLEHKIANIKTKWLANYAYTKSINRTGLDQFDRSVDKQLTYVPINKASVTLINELKAWSILINAVYTGKRYVSADNEESLPNYTLVNLKMSRSMLKGRYQFKGHININNILNTQYQSVENRAMPGINLLIGISVSYYKSKIK